MSFLFGEPKLSNKELHECILWLGKHYEHTIFQTREADLHNDVLLEFHKSILRSASASMESGSTAVPDMHPLLRAGHRDVQAATEIISRMKSTDYVPDAALSLYRQWLVTMANHKEYAMARYSFYTSTEKGMEPNEEPVYIHRKALEDNQRKAEKEEIKLWKRMTSSVASITERQKLIDNAEKTVADENWQPLEIE